MKKCPFCGADLPEEAAFCVYCMRSLTEKKAPTLARKGNKRLWIIPAAVLVAGILCGVILGLKAKQHPETDPRAEIYVDAAEFAAKGKIASEGLPYQGKAVWRPEEMEKISENALWECYRCPGVFENTDPVVCFKKDGTDVLVILNDLDLTEQTAARKVLENLSVFICRKGYFDLAGYLDSIRWYQAEEW